MIRRITAIAIIAIFLSASLSIAADKAAGTEKPKNFWQRLFSYPANVTKESAKVVTDAGTNSANMVVKEIQTGGEVATGDVKKTPELVTEPVKDTVNATAQAVTETVSIPVTAAQDSASTEVK